MRVPRYSELVPAALAGLDAVPAYPARFFQAVQASDLYQVRQSHLAALSCSHPADSVSNAESSIAPYLTELQARVKKEGIRVGSCKHCSSDCLAEHSDWRADS